MIVGVDVGTTVTKAALIGTDGRSVRSAAAPSRLVRRGTEVEQDLEDVLSTVASVVREVCAGLDGPVDAVALTGQGDGLWLRDAEGRAVRPPISWQDGRASALVEQWRAEGDPDGVMARVFALTGSGLFPGSHAALLAHLAAHEPDSLHRATVAGYCIDAVLQRLTGVVSVDASDASLPFLDVRRRAYVDEALELCGVAPWRHLLAEPAPPGTVFALDAAGAEMLGLPVGTPVTAGPYDLQACGFGSGTVDEGDATMVVGTTLACQVLTTDATVRPGDEPAGMWLCTPDPATYLHVMPSMVGTAGVDWALRTLGLEVGALDGLLADSTPGAGGVRALPYYSGAGERAPFVDPRARGRLDGMTLATTPADLVRAVCESVAYAARHCFDRLGLSGEVAACGGGTRSQGWLQIFADVLGTDVHVPREPLVGARGAALVAWNSLGVAVDVEAWRADRDVVRPSAAAPGYETGYRRYLDDLALARTSWGHESSGLGAAS
ncbi:FGGY-family carbohydrate kinase [Mumia quercus]|uniref:FGGY-family carbohydrate kinase n=1 Tax=Mumia quercus TaxID=2976125 RepID=UPI0021CE6B91|nr:FGGY-family carbohydrate kinase [Mumia quercus]